VFVKFVTLLDAVVPKSAVEILEWGFTAKLVLWTRWQNITHSHK